jgi:hypothetical protein
MILNNLFNQASTIIPSQGGEILRWRSRERNAKGQWVDTYDPPSPICGSFQAVPRNIFEKMGLDYKKVYYMIFTSADVSGLARNESGDRILYKGLTLKAETEGGWVPVDGWTGVLLVEIPNDRQ